MLMPLVDDGVVPIVAWSAFIVLIGVGLMFYQTRDMRRLNFVMAYAFVVAFGFSAGSFIDVLLYADQIGGIQGGTPYIFAIMFGAPLIYVVSVLALYVGAFIVDKSMGSKDI